MLLLLLLWVSYPKNHYQDQCLGTFLLLFSFGNFMVSGLMFNQFRVNFCEWYMKGVQCHSFAGDYPVFLESFAEETILPHWGFFALLLYVTLSNMCHYVLCSIGVCLLILSFEISEFLLNAYSEFFICYCFSVWFFLIIFIFLLISSIWWNAVITPLFLQSYFSLILWIYNSYFKVFVKYNTWLLSQVVSITYFVSLS